MLRPTSPKWAAIRRGFDQPRMVSTSMASVTVQGDMTGPMSARMVAGGSRKSISRFSRPPRGGLCCAPPGMGVREVNVGRRLERAVRPSGSQGHRHARTARRIETASWWKIANRLGAVPERRRSSSCSRCRATREAKNICYVTMKPAGTLWCASTSARGRTGRVPWKPAVKRSDDYTVRPRAATFPLLWTHLIPATLEGRATPQCAERHVRRGRWGFRSGFKLRCDSAGAAHLSTRRFFPGRPDA